MRRRRPDVGDDQVGLMCPDQIEQPHGVSSLPDHLESGPLKQAGEPLAHEDVVIGDDHRQCVRDRTAHASGVCHRGFNATMDRCRAEQR
jgi:hypothetical protein